MSDIGDLLDVNVWLALVVEGHPHHGVALGNWESFRRPMVCRVTQLSLLRLLCNRQVMGNEVFEPEQAWKTYEQLIAARTVEFAHEPRELDSALKPLLKGARAGRDFWTDAYLASFAQCAGLRLVTFDAGFLKFRGLDALVLPSSDT